MRNRNTIEYLGMWETIFNPDFKPIEFDRFKRDAGLNAFTLSPQKWVTATGAIGIITRSGRYGGTFAHKDIAFKFASWISVEFELYMVKEFQRLKEQEQSQIGWTAKRELAKMNFFVRTSLPPVEGVSVHIASFRPTKGAISWMEDQRDSHGKHHCVKYLLLLCLLQCFYE